MKKVTFYSDEEIWKNFSTKILEEEGSPRKISQKIQNLIIDYLLIEYFEEIFKKFGIKEKFMLSSNEIKKNRPTVTYSSGNIIREDRDTR